MAFALGRKRQADFCEFKRAGSKTVRATQKNPVLKSQGKKKTNLILLYVLMRHMYAEAQRGEERCGTL